MTPRSDNLQMTPLQGDIRVQKDVVSSSSEYLPGNSELTYLTISWSEPSFQILLDWSRGKCCVVSYKSIDVLLAFKTPNQCLGFIK